MNEGLEDRSHRRDHRGPSRRIFTTGFNVHGQLSPETNQDLNSFQAIPDLQDRDAHILFTGWSATVITTGNTVISLGHGRFHAELDEEDCKLRCGTGDHDGLNVCLDQDGNVYIVEGPPASRALRRLIPRSSEGLPRLSHVAQAGNGRVVVTVAQAVGSYLCHILEFPSTSACLRWCEDPSGKGHGPDNHHMVRGRPRQLLANTATFVLLMEDGDVYTWGDPRYQSLARPITGDSSTPADTPGPVEALGGLRMVKVACGGWIGAALSEDHSLYVWGATTPGTSDTIECLQPDGDDRVALVELPGNNSAVLDVQDVAVGDNHIVVISQDSRVFAVGDNTNGQLGLPASPNFHPTWQQAPLLGSPQNVTCGPKATFVVVTFDSPI